MTIFGLPFSDGHFSLENGASRVVVGTMLPSDPNTHSHIVLVPSDVCMLRS